MTSFQAGDTFTFGFLSQYNNFYFSQKILKMQTPPRPPEGSILRGRGPRRELGKLAFYVAFPFAIYYIVTETDYMMWYNNKVSLCRGLFLPLLCFLSLPPRDGFVILFLVASYSLIAARRISETFDSPHSVCSFLVLEGMVRSSPKRTLQRRLLMRG